MNGRIRSSSTAKGVFALLLLCAFVIRLLAPVGFMPSRGAHGLVITLCTGAGAVKAVLPIEHSDESPDHGQKGGDCGFAQGVAPGFAPPPAMVPPAIAPALPLLLASRKIADLVIHRMAAPPPPPLGPPTRD